MQYIRQAWILCREAQITVCSQESHFISVHSFTPNENLPIRTRYAEMLSLFSVTADMHWRAGVLTFIRTMLKSREILALCVTAFDPSIGQLPLCPALLFFSLHDDGSIPCWRGLPSRKWKIKTSSAVIVLALASVLFWKLVMLLLRDNLLLKQQLYLLPWKERYFCILRTPATCWSVDTPYLSSYHQCRWCLIKNKILFPHLLSFLRRDMEEGRAQLLK